MPTCFRQRHSLYSKRFIPTCLVSFPSAFTWPTREASLDTREGERDAPTRALSQSSASARATHSLGSRLSHCLRVRSWRRPSGCRPLIWQDPRRVPSIPASILPVAPTNLPDYLSEMGGFITEFGPVVVVHLYLTVPGHHCLQVCGQRCQLGGNSQRSPVPQ